MPNPVRESNGYSNSEHHFSHSGRPKRTPHSLRKPMVKKGSTNSLYSSGISEHGSDDGPILFPCAKCRGRLPTKMVDGQIVKRYDDDTCAHCWAATDILEKPGKYGFTQEICDFILHLDPNDVHLIIEQQESTLYADLLTGLHHFEGFKNPMQNVDSLIAFLDPIKAYNLPLLIRLHKRVTENNQWWA